MQVRNTSVLLVATLLSGFWTSGALAATDLETLETECSGDLGGVVTGDSCEVTTIVELPYAEMIRPSGKSGLGWTAVGVIVQTTVDVYGIEESTEESEVSVFVAGNPSLPGCGASNNQPKKCVDHFETSVEEITVYSWVFDTSSTSEEVVVTGCLNPAGRNMGMHLQCSR